MLDLVNQERAKAGLPALAADMALTKTARIKSQELLRRFGPHWRVLFSYLVLYGFIYPSHRGDIPSWVMDRLTDALKKEAATPPPQTRICQGTLLSREQFLIDIQQWGYLDARLLPGGNMTRAEADLWTAAIGEKK